MQRYQISSYKITLVVNGHFRSNTVRVCLACERMCPSSLDKLS